MGLTTSAFDNALKEVYLPEIREQLNAKTRVLNDMTKADISQLQWEGRVAVVSLHSGRSNAVKATAEGGFLPTASSQQYAELNIPMRFLHGRIELSTQVIKASRSNKGSFARAMEREKQGIVDDLSRQRNRMLFGAGRGQLALVNGAVVTSTTVNVDNPGGVAGSVNGTRFIKPGMFVTFHDASTGAVEAVAKVASVTDSDTFETAAAISADDNAPITLGVNNGGTLEGSLDIEPMGLLGIVDSTTFVSSIHGLDRSLAANAFFRANIVPSVGAISLDVLQRGIDNTEEISGEIIDTFYCHSSVRREYLKLLEADRRYVGESLRRPDAGTDAGAHKADITFNSFPWKIEKDAPYGILFGINKSHLYWIPEVEGEWMDEDGAILNRVKDKDAFEAAYRLFENFFSDKGNSGVRFDGINATVTSSVFSD
ncbi:MAG: phage major capsid protein [Acidobacteriales bacterium]|nr:phage major capsid protein [Terriglobales bacterium]